MTKAARHLLILKLIGEKSVKTQEELVTLLENEGVKVTQATVSRDIKELNLIKKQHQGELYYEEAGEEKTTGLKREEISTRDIESRVETVFRESIVEISSAYFLVIIRTLPGLAQGTAALIDELNWKEVAGTIAGDDTIFIAVKNQDEVETLIERLSEKLRDDYEY